MASTAISAQGSTLKIGTGSGSALNVTDVANTSPCEVTLSSVTGLSVGDVVTFASVGGTTELNGNSYVIESIDTLGSTITLAGVDATGYGAHTSGGTATPTTWSAIANVRSFSGFDGSASEIDVTNLSSVAKEFRLGLVDPGMFTIEIDQNNADAGQMALRAAQVSGGITQFKLTLPNAETATFSAFVKKFSTQGGVDAVVRSSVDMRITGAVTWA